MDSDTEQAPWQRLGHRFTLGLRSRSEADWLPASDAFGDPDRRSRQIAEKAGLFDERHDEVFATTAEGLAASDEVLAMVTAHLKTHHNAAQPEPEPGLHPLEAAARLVPEDLLLLGPRTRKDDPDILDWCLVAAALAFPAHWVLAEKMRRPLAGIHEPVPHYGEQLETPMDRFFTRMQTGPISHRWNWSVVTTDQLFTPHRMRRAPLTPGAGIDDIFLRMESQTLRKLADSGHILFTIRTYVEPLRRWADIPGALESLVDMLDLMTPQMRDYKGVELFEDALKAHVAATG
ncbi:MAG: heme-dependent oxidative N-demethylase family protein [Candidatus Puniceispirillaceae bacterium]